MSRKILHALERALRKREEYWDGVVRKNPSDESAMAIQTSIREIRESIVEVATTEVIPEEDPALERPPRDIYSPQSKL